MTMNILASVHFAQYFSFAVIMSEINPIDHESNSAAISACIFLMKVFVKLFVNCLSLKEVEVGFSIYRDYGMSKRHYCAYYVWCLDLENMKDFFEKVWDYQEKIRHCDLLHHFMFHDTKSCKKNNVPLLHRKRGHY